jgi:hypothetical protein
MAFNAFSQLGPGYMGKRLMIGYGFYFSPAILGSNGSQGSIIGRGNALGGDLAFNSNHEGFLEYSFKNRASVGLSCRYYHSTFDNSTSLSATIYTSTGQDYAYGTPGGFYDIHGLNYSLYFKFYGRRYVSPWGPYFLMGPVVNTYRSFYDPSTMLVGDGDNYSSKPVAVDFGPQGEFFGRGDLMFGWGRNRIIGNRVTLDYGINFELIALAFTLWDTIGESPVDVFTEEGINNFNYIEKTSKRRVREVNRLNAYLKIGVLLF